LRGNRSGSEPILTEVRSAFGTCIPNRKVDDMAARSQTMLPQLLLLAAGALMFMNTAASAQFLQEGKSVKFGTGCQERMKPMQAGLGTCLITDKRARVWCPNGKVFERDGELPHVSLVRSACGLSQVL
jgi:hypothetical protein